MDKRACAFCGWTPDRAGRWLRLGDDRTLHDAGGELICSLCVTPADTGSRRYSPGGARERERH